MKFDIPIVEATLIKRYKRFLADVRMPDGTVIVAHVPNSGSMLGVSEPGSLCRVSLSNKPGRKLPYTLEMVRTTEGQWVGVNTSLTNKLVNEAFHKRKIKEWNKFQNLKSEVKINEESRLDFMLSSEKRKCYVEVKNVSMARAPVAVFPDAKTQRGQKHLLDLANLAKKGHEAEIFFVVQREDCKVFRPCDDIDPVYGKLLREVAKKKVAVRCWSCELSAEGIEISKELKVDLN